MSTTTMSAAANDTGEKLALAFEKLLAEHEKSVRLTPVQITKRTDTGKINGIALTKGKTQLGAWFTDGSTVCGDDNIKDVFYGCKTLDEAMHTAYLFCTCQPSQAVMDSFYLEKAITTAAFEGLERLLEAQQVCKKLTTFESNIVNGAVIQVHRFLEFCRKEF